MRNNEKQYVLVGLGLTFLYWLWMGVGHWKLGTAIINTLFLVSLVWFYRLEVKKNKFWWFGWGTSLLLGLFLIIRSSWISLTFNIAAIFLINILIAGLTDRPEKEIRPTSLIGNMIDFLRNTVRSLIENISGLLGIMPKKFKGWQKLLVGVMMAIPLVLIFGALFYSADPIFQKVVDSIHFPKIRLSDILSFRNISTIVFFGAAGAVLRGKLKESSDDFKPWKYITETNIAVLILEILFLIFSIIQIRFLFAGIDTLKSMDIVFSDYTRRGYGQMIVACILAWGVVYWLDYSLRSQKKLGIDQSKYTKILSGAIVGEIFLFIAAATRRNWLYQSAYGFTEIRLLGFWLSAWLISVSGLIIFKIYKNKSINFLARGMITASLITLLGINFFNIDKVIVVSRPAKLAQGIDYEYMAALSNDSVDGWSEVLKDVASRIQNNEITSKAEVLRLRSILGRISNRESSLDLQARKYWNYMGSWNYSDYRAIRFVKSHKEEIAKLQKDLDIVENQIAESQKKTVKVRADLYRGKIREILLKKGHITINDLDSWNPIAGQQNVFMNLDFTKSISDNEFNELSVQIQRATDSNCWMAKRLTYPKSEPIPVSSVFCNL